MTLDCSISAARSWSEDEVVGEVEEDVIFGRSPDTSACAEQRDVSGATSAQRGAGGLVAKVLAAPAPAVATSVPAANALPPSRLRDPGCMQPGSLLGRRCHGISEGGEIT